MRKWDYKKVFITLLAVWFIINFLQAIFTEIFSDEAYYYMYGKYLAWGYFDHPPMIALMIRISTLFFNGNLGVRLITILVQLCTITLIWKTLKVKDPEPSHVFLFFIITGSLWMFSAYGFISSPDAPLLFFTALFLFLYKNFLEDQSWKTVVLLSLSMAGMVYSKYQAVLIIGFVVLSNLKLLKSYKFWLSGIVALLLLSPHMYWQFANDFPSLKYHLVDRSDGFRWKFLLEYIPNQMAVFNPLIFGLVIYVLVKFRPGDLFTRALYFLIIGFVGFFWVTAFRGHVEPQWTLSCSIPIILILFNRILESQLLRKYVRKIVFPALILLPVFRIFLVTDLPLVRSLDIIGKEEQFKFVESVANNLPVVFSSSYQSPSLFTFFTGKVSFPVSGLDTRQTQYDIWQLEKNYQNKPAFIASTREGRSKLFEKDKIQFTGYVTSSLQTTNRVRILFDSPPEAVTGGDSISLSIKLSNPGGYDVDFNHFDFPVRVCSVFLTEKDITAIPVELSAPVNILHQGESLNRTIKSVIPDLPAGEYKYGISLNTFLGTTLNSTFVKIKISKHD
jgi:hypothetical protein